jgi:hypothetical protein
VTARGSLLLAALLCAASCGSDDGGDGGSDALASIDWGQWARDSVHSGQSPVAGQPLARLLVDRVFDPFADDVAASTGAVLIHYQVPLLAGPDVYMTFKAGTLAAPAWTVKGMRFEGDALQDRFTFASDWRPVPGLSWEPVFHPALAGNALYVPASSGGVFRVDRATGAQLARIDPFPGAGDTFVVGPLTVAPDGSILYNALAIDPAGPFVREARGAWIVRITADDRFQAVSYAGLVPGAPASDAPCELQFDNAQLPWPPSAAAQPGTAPCGAQRPGVNVAPAVAADGSVVSVTRAHLNSRYGFVVALNRDLTPRWAASLRGRLSDGCGSALLPANGAPGGCRTGARPGVDPATNAPPAGRVLDTSSASPVIAPDGSILYGAYTRYNYARGHLFRFDANGGFLGSFDYGWDVTPAIYSRAGTYSLVVKNNDYDAGSYCQDARFCPPKPDGPYRLTQLTPELVPEWHSDPVPDEWCVNGPAVDRDGTVYAPAEDGYFYAIRQGGAVRDRILLAQAIGAAYTPVAIDRDGRLFTLNYGRLFVAGR